MIIGIITVVSLLIAGIYGGLNEVASNTKQHKTDEKAKVKQSGEDGREVVELEPGNYNLNDYKLSGRYQMHVEGEGEFQLEIEGVSTKMFDTKISDVENLCYIGQVCSLNLVLADGMVMNLGKGIEKATFIPVVDFNLNFDSMNAGSYVVGHDLEKGHYKLKSNTSNSGGMVRIIHTEEDSISEYILVHPDKKKDLENESIDTHLMKTEIETHVDQGDVIIFELNSFQIEKID